MSLPAHSPRAAEARSPGLPERGSAEWGQLVADLDSIAKAAVLRGQVAGRSVAVLRGRDTLLFASYGLRVLDPRLPATDSTVYEIGSVTKQFTAAAMLQLVEQGRIALDGDVSRYYRGYPSHGQVTVRRLLTNTSGIRGYTEMPSFARIRASELPRDSLVGLFAAEPFVFEPGTAQLYSNSGFFLAGRLVEKVSGTPFERYVERELFARLGMRHSSYCRNGPLSADKAAGYAKGSGDFERVAQVNHRWPYSAGSLCSSLGDMVTWLRALHGGQLLSPRMYREMTTPARLTDGTVLRYAMGLYVGDDPAGHAMIGHGGAIPGHLSETRHYPQSGLDLVVLQNTNGPSAPEVIADALAERALGRRPRVAEIAVEDPSRYVGSFVGPTRNQPDARIDVVRGSQGLTYSMDDGAPMPLRHVGDGVFTAGASRTSWPFTPIRLTFRERAGRLTELRFDNGYGHSVHRRP